MISIIIFFLLVSIIIYVLLGGADFGAGIIELFAGPKNKQQTIKVINNAIAPVWEANHMWLIIAVVILFNAFPKIYTTVSVYLYIPLIILLLGIVLRGTSFVFRHYDAYKDGSHKIYNIVFAVSSLIVSFTFGLIIGALMSNKLTAYPANFYDGYIRPWLNIFTISVGAFVTALFTFAASVYLIGEALNPEDKKAFITKAKIASITLVCTGGVVFISSVIDGNDFMLVFLSNWKSQALIIASTLAIPFTWKIISLGMGWMARAFAGVHIVLVLSAFYVAFFPVVVRFKDMESLTLFNSAAPEITLRYLVYALLIGSCIIFPMLGYLMKVFKHNA
ncbi:MAG: cytochrome d ubiquinol oxidase subunit II [Bacteroidota bacterium]|nr:cytochrome d ubiquinol oxidase subunit II [Bacteroidota bacterium]